MICLDEDLRQNDLRKDDMAKKLVEQWNRVADDF